MAFGCPWNAVAFGARASQSYLGVVRDIHEGLGERRGVEPSNTLLSGSH